MLRYTASLLALVLVTALPTNSTTLAAPGDIVATLDSPCEYPTGLASDESRLYIADWRHARIHTVDLTGRVGASVAGNSFPAPTLRPHGLTYGNGLLYVSDDHTGKIFTLNPKTLTVEHTFDAPGKCPTGLAWANGTLYILERSSAKIYKVIPKDGTILDYVDVPDRSCTCMTFHEGYLLISNRVDDEIYLVQPDTGHVVGVVNAPGPHVTGLVWQGDELLTADFQDRKLHKIKLADEPMYTLSEKRRSRVEFLWDFYNYGPETVSDLVVNLGMPMELPAQKLLSDPVFSIEPSMMTKDVFGQACAIFNLGEVEAGKRIQLTYKIDAEISTIRYLIIPERCGTLADIPDRIKELYLRDGERYRLESDFIKHTVEKVVGDEKNPYWIARRIYDHLIANLHYEMVGGWDVPEVVLKRGSGSCSEYTFAFVALCRAAGLPARYQGSVVVRGDDASIDEAHHRWAQVYLPNYGWVPVDANRGDVDSPVGQCKGFGELKNRFLITTQSGGDSAYLGWSYNQEEHFQTTGYCNIVQSTIGLWHPLPQNDQSTSPTRQKGDDGRTCQSGS